MTTVPAQTTDTSTHIVLLKQAESFSSAAGLDYIDILIDQSGTSQPLQNTILQLSPVPRWFALFEGTPEAGAIEYSPLVIRLHFVLNEHRQYLEQLAKYFAGTPRLTLLITPLDFDLLSRHLQVLSQVQWEEQTGLLRYYDNRVFPSLFTHVLNNQQQAAFTDIALFWGWRDRDGEIVWKTGNFAPERRLADKPEMNRVDDGQVGLMGCISDAEALMKEKMIGNSSLENYFAHCLKTAVKANNAGYFGPLRDFKG